MSSSTDYFADDANCKHALKVLRALAHLLRLKMLSYIEDKGEANVSDIQAHVKITVSEVSQHLKILRECGLVQTRRQAKNVYYRLNTAYYYKVIEAVNNFSASKS